MEYVAGKKKPGWAAGVSGGDVPSPAVETSSSQDAA